MLTDVKAMTPEWLTAHLRENGYLAQGEVTAVNCSPTIERMAAFITPLKISYSADTPPSAPTALIHKLFRSSHFRGGIAEVPFYSKIVTSVANAAVPQCFGSYINYETKLAALLLQDISQTHNQLPWPIPDNLLDEAALHQFADEILKFHTHWWQHPQLNDDLFLRPHGGPLRMVQAITPDGIRQHAANIMQLFPEMVAKLGDKFRPHWHGIYERAIEKWPELLIQRTQNGQGVTLIHGDYHLFNTYFPNDPSAHGLMILDWETYKRGLGVYDLAYPMTLSLMAHRRRQLERPLLRYYHTQLLAAGIENYGWDDCLADYRLSVLACLFPPLLWPRHESIEDAMVAFNDWGCIELIR
ncbi:MAG: phosphotransferase [Chloroflexota bacterium]